MPLYCTRLGSVMLVLGALLAACSEANGSATAPNAPLVHRLNITVPARTPTIQAGKLAVFLYADEPPLDDRYDDLEGLDVQEVPFKHQQGAPTRKTVTLSGEVPEGYNYGVHVLGYERRNGGWKQMLWDGQDGTELAPYSQVELLRFPDETPEADLLAGSLREWQRLKKANGGAYRYEVGFSSMVGEYGKTTFEVRDDRVVMRAFERRMAGTDDEPVESWTERGNAVGSHDEDEPVRTVDELYAVCRNEVLTRDRFENIIEVDFRDNGVLKVCLYAGRLFADDFGTGARIDDLRFLRDDAGEQGFTTDINDTVMYRR